MTLKTQYKAEFDVWRSARHRCSNPKSHAWKNYGGRGIRMCDRWAADFAAFLADVGARPSPKHSLDRVDNDRGYEPGNCKWVTRAEQGQNTRRSTDRQIINCIKLLHRQCVRRNAIIESLGVSGAIVDRVISGETWSDDVRLGISETSLRKRAA